MPPFVADKDTLSPLRGQAKKDHEAALAKFHVSASYFVKQRERELADLKFVDFDEMWPPDSKAQRAGQQTGGTSQGLPPTPPRPSIVINMLRAPLATIANSRRQAKLALEFAPKGAGAAQDVADVYEDIVRGIQQESRAGIARNWAGDRAEKCGMGWYRIDTEYCLDHPDENDPAWNDQDIVYRRILNQASVYPPHLAQEPDFSDGEDWFVTEDMAWRSYKAAYPKSKLAQLDDPSDGGGGDGAELSAIGDKLPDWVFTAEGDSSAGKTVRVAEHWHVDEEWETMKVGERSRKIRKRTVYWSKLNAIEYLEEPREWNGSYVPLIPVIADEYNVNGERRWQGIVRPSRDSSLSYCVMRSAQIEAIGLATKAPYIGYFESIEPYLEWWKQSATRNFYMLPISAKARDASGNPLPPPQRTVQEPAIQAMTLASQAAKEDVQATTLVPPAALGQLDPHDRSGKAITALQSQSELATGGYLDNLVSISMAYEGKVLRDLIPRIYDRPGRVMPAVDQTESKRLIMINYPFVPDPQTKEPVPVPGWQAGMPIPEGAEYIDLQKGEYTVTATVGKSFNTRRAESRAAIADVIQMAQGTPVSLAVIPAYLEELDYPGARKIAEIAKKALPPELQAAYQDNPQMPPPEQLQAMVQQLQQQNQQLQQAVATKMPELQNKAQIAQMQEQTDLQKAREANQTAIQKAEIAATATMSNAQAKVDAENFRSYVDAMETRLGKSLDLHMQHVSDTLQRAHEATMATMQQAHEKHLQALQQVHEQQLAGQQQDHEQQLAAMQPAPTNGGDNTA